MEHEKDIELLETLLSIYRSTLHNWGDQSYEEIDKETDEYWFAIRRLERYADRAAEALPEMPYLEPTEPSVPEPATPVASNCDDSRLANCVSAKALTVPTGLLSIRS